MASPVVPDVSNLNTPDCKTVLIDIIFGEAFSKRLFIILYSKKNNILN